MPLNLRLVPHSVYPHIVIGIPQERDPSAALRARGEITCRACDDVAPLAPRLEPDRVERQVNRFVEAHKGCLKDRELTVVRL